MFECCSRWALLLPWQPLCIASAVPNSNLSLSLFLSPYRPYFELKSKYYLQLEVGAFSFLWLCFIHAFYLFRFIYFFYSIFVCFERAQPCVFMVKERENDLLLISNVLLLTSVLVLPAHSKWREKSTSARRNCPRPKRSTGRPCATWRPSRMRSTLADVSQPWAPAAAELELSKTQTPAMTSATSKWNQTAYPVSVLKSQAFCESPAIWRTGCWKYV